METISSLTFVPPKLIFYFLKGNVHSAMARGIEHSRMALVFVTREYEVKVNGGGPKVRVRIIFF